MSQPPTAATAGPSRASPARPRVVVTDHDYAGLDPEEAVLGPLGVELVDARCQSEDELVAACADADAILNQYLRLTPRVFAALRRCRVVVRYGVGYDNVDLDAATAAGVPVCNVPDYGVEEVSDHAIALLLALARKVVLLDRRVRAGVWDVQQAKPVHRLAGRTLGVVGLGRIGSAVARKAQGLGLRVIAWDPYRPADYFAERGVEPVALDQLLERSDFVSVHTPLNDETRGLIGAAELGRMQPGAFLINTARGAIVDERALVEALRSGRLGGAALDVLEREPIPAGHPLLGFDNCILTPHAAWFSAESFVSLKTLAAEEVARALRGEPLSNVVNPEVLSRP